MGRAKEQCRTKGCVEERLEGAGLEPVYIRRSRTHRERAWRLIAGAVWELGLTSLPVRTVRRLGGELAAIAARIKGRRR